MPMARNPEPATPLELERKLTTILSADVAGYSRLMAEDEEATLSTFRRHRAVFEVLVALHRGRIFNTAGDAILAEFASTLEAVRCASEIQALLRTRNDQLPPARRVEFRIGVNLGDVVVQGTDLLGDGVNVAARLQAGAPPGGVWMSGSVHEQVRNKVALSFRPLGDQNFKNIPKPVRAFAIVGAEAPTLLTRRRDTAVRWLAAASVLLAIGGGYWGYAQYQAAGIERAAAEAAGQQTALAEAARQNAERHLALLQSERAAADAARRAAEAALRQQQANAAAPPTPAKLAAAAVPAPAAAGGDKVFGGLVCYGGPTSGGSRSAEAAECSQARVTVSGGTIAGKWPGANPGVTNVAAGKVAASGEANIEIDGEAEDGSRIFTVNLSGTIQAGKLDASGRFPDGRPAWLSWRHLGG